MNDQTTAASMDDATTETMQGDLRNAEKDFRRLIEKRNELNDLAREARDERDALNEQKKNLVTQMRQLQSERDAKNASAREAKEQRNEAQRQAKALIENKRKMRKDTTATGQGGVIRALENEIRAMERIQETTVLTIPKEKDLLDKLRLKSKELESAKLVYAEEAKLLADVKDIDQKIDELFRAADEAHKRVVELSNEGQALHDQIGPVLDQLKFLDSKSDEKHTAYVSLRKEADEYHTKGMALREQVEKLRDERRKLYGERKAEVQNVNKDAREQLFDEAKIEDKADDAMKALLAGGKISL